ncbi:MAG: response regulator transcription factor [Nitrospira sp. CG24A]|nr:MAG: response regulator transcription factor [Nitrospira sp. CG24A]
MMELRKILSGRFFAGILCIGALCVGATDLSHAATISFMNADPVRASAPFLSATAGRVEAQPVTTNEASALASGADSIPQFQSGSFNVITRAILRMSFCVCSSFHRVFASGVPLSTESTAPALPAPAIPGAVLLFMTGIVGVVGVARRTQSMAVRPAPWAAPIDAPHIPVSGYLLLVSGDTWFSRDLATRCIRYGYVVESVSSTAEAASLAARQAPALVFVDRRRSGWQTVRQAAPFRSVPMMTVVPAGPGWTEEACVDDLEHGMDSTHVCDQNSRLLIAKVRALLRRSGWLTTVPTVVRAGQVELDIDRCEVRVAGQANHLPPVQFKLLKRLMESPGTVFRRQDLLDHIWGEGYAVEAHTLDVHLFWLRRLLERDPARRQTIATVRRVGIKFVVNHVADESAGPCRAWPSTTAIRRPRIPRRRTDRRLQVVKPIGIRAAV